MEDAGWSPLNPEVGASLAGEGASKGPPERCRTRVPGCFPCERAAEMGGPDMGVGFPLSEMGYTACHLAGVWRTTLLQAPWDTSAPVTPTVAASASPC